MQLRAHERNLKLIYLFILDLRLGLGEYEIIKKARSARVANAGQGNIATVHEPKPMQAIGSL